MKERRVKRRTENEATTTERQRRDDFMKGRIWYYGYPCLSDAEAQCMRAELSVLRMDRVSVTDRTQMETRVSARGLQVEVANRMGVSRQWVGDLLRRAEMAMAWMAEHDVYARWARDEIGWYLDAPIGIERKKRANKGATR